MSEFMTALLISGSIFVLMMATQLGRREYTWHKVLTPVLSVAGFGYAYLRNLPTGGSSVTLYLVGIAIGAVFAVLASLSTGVERESSTGKLITTTGRAFVLTWLVAMALRVGFVFSVDHLGNFRDQVGTFLMSHQIAQNSITPFFVLMALTTVLGRVVAVRTRMRRLTRTGAIASAPVAVTV